MGQCEGQCVGQGEVQCVGQGEGQGVRVTINLRMDRAHPPPCHTGLIGFFSLYPGLRLFVGRILLGYCKPPERPSRTEQKKVTTSHNREEKSELEESSVCQVM